MKPEIGTLHSKAPLLHPLCLPAYIPTTSFKKGPSSRSLSPKALKQHGILNTESGL
jgi:hypothetical protein